MAIKQSKAETQFIVMIFSNLMLWIMLLAGGFLGGLMSFLVFTCFSIAIFAYGTVISVETARLKFKDEMSGHVDHCKGPRMFLAFLLIAGMVVNGYLITAAFMAFSIGIVTVMRDMIMRD